MNAPRPTDAITLNSVSKSYGSGEALQHVLDKVDLRISRGEFTVVSGPSGCGKSTLLNLMGGIDQPDGGSVLIEGAETGDLGDRALARLRNDTLGFIFQSFHLVPVLSALENVCLPMTFRNRDRGSRIERGRHLLDQMGLDSHMHKKPGSMSGGQRQRVAIARALACNPSIVLADEPTGNLDSRTAEEIISLLRELNDKENTTFVFSTHDPMVVNYAKRRVSFEDRKLVDASRKPTKRKRAK